MEEGLVAAGEEGFAAVRVENGVALAANSGAGLANALYAVRRAGLAGRPWPEGVSAPALSLRDVYHFLSPWRRNRLSVDSLLWEDWVEHMDNIRRLGANRIYTDFWATQYYHPDYPETRENLPLWELLKRVYDYAHRIGLRTGVFLFPHQAPAWLYERHPELRGIEAVNYHGIHLCWSRARDLIQQFDRQVFEFFGKSLDDAVVEFQDPGSCFCKECCDRFPEIVLETMALYRSWMGAGPAPGSVHPAFPRLDRGSVIPGGQPHPSSGEGFAREGLSLPG